ncbi:MAG: hypothetical protein RL158_1034 [Bacteroidota bacterium]
MSIYSIAQTKFLSDIEQAEQHLTHYEMFNLFLDSMTKDKKQSFLEDIKDEMRNEGYTILKARNLVEKIRLEELEEEMYPYYNERMFL